MVKYILQDWSTLHFYKYKLPCGDRDCIVPREGMGDTGDQLDYEGVPGNVLGVMGAFTNLNYRGWFFLCLLMPSF